MDKFNFDAPAELFPSRNNKIAKKLKYRRFNSAAEAIRFAVEDMPEQLLLGTTIEIDEKRLGHQDIRALYERPDFPRNKAA
jgi:Arc/MetJ-type ribon-helix-helix transcriptional regulator